MAIGIQTPGTIFPEGLTPTFVTAHLNFRISHIWILCRLTLQIIISCICFVLLLVSMYYYIIDICFSTKIFSEDFQRIRHAFAWCGVVDLNNTSKLLLFIKILWLTVYYIVILEKIATGSRHEANCRRYLHYIKLVIQRYNKVVREYSRKHYDRSVL